MIEGGSSDRETARLAAYENPQWFSKLMAMLIDQSVTYLSAQIEAGADVVQIFDSWAGDLPVSLREKWVTAPLAEITAKLRSLHPGIPVIVFARGVVPRPAIAEVASTSHRVGWNWRSIGWRSAFRRLCGSEISIGSAAGRRSWRCAKR
jgi:uroporphyrinogen-III decarboxylase